MKWKINENTHENDSSCSIEILESGLFDDKFIKMYKNYKKRWIQKSDFQDLEKHKKIFGVVPDDRYFASK
jgi:hypothetical protein